MPATLRPPAGAALLLCLSGAFHGPAALAQDGLHDYVEVAFSLYNPDWERRENATGATLLASRSLGRRFHVEAGVNLLETADTGLDVRSVRGRAFRNWHTVGIGIHGEWGPRYGYAVTASYQGVEVEGRGESGAGLSAGLSVAAVRSLDLGVEIGVLDLVIRDTTLAAHLHYRLNDTTTLTGRIADYAEWDFTRYEIGLRARF